MHIISTFHSVHLTQRMFSSSSSSSENPNKHSHRHTNVSSNHASKHNSNTRPPSNRNASLPNTSQTDNQDIINRKNDRDNNKKNNGKQIAYQINSRRSLLKSAIVPLHQTNSTGSRTVQLSAIDELGALCEALRAMGSRYGVILSIMHRYEDLCYNHRNHGQNKITCHRNNCPCIPIYKRGPRRGNRDEAGISSMKLLFSIFASSCCLLKWTFESGQKVVTVLVRVVVTPRSVRVGHMQPFPKNICFPHER